MLYGSVCVSHVGLSCFISSPVIDLLAPLNMSHHISGVSILQSPPGRATYRIRPKAPNLILPREYSHFLYSNLQGGMGVHLVGHQASGSSATLFSLSSASSPILQIISSTINDTLRVDYQAGGGAAQSLASFHFPRRNPFSREEWVQLAVSLETDRLAFFVDCQEAVVLQLKSQERINLQMPQDVVVTLASTPGKKDSKFSVSFFSRTYCIPAHTRTLKGHETLPLLIFAIIAVIQLTILDKDIMLYEPCNHTLLGHKRSYTCSST